MDNKMMVNIDEMLEITSLLLSKLKENLGNEIELKNDFYWDIKDDEMYNPYSEPTNISLGQLSDDLIRLRNLSSNTVVAYDLKRLCEVLKAISIENPIAI